MKWKSGYKTEPIKVQNMKDIAKIRNSVDGVNNRLNIAEERLSQLKDKSE